MGEIKNQNHDLSDIFTYILYMYIAQKFVLLYCLHPWKYFEDFHSKMDYE
jgi:hypothetical protein